MGESYLSLRGVSKSFGTGANQIHAVDTISQDVNVGEFVSIVGPSGCGKSTLLSLIAGLAEPTGGLITIGGEAVEHPRREVGLMFQSPVLLAWRTAIENVLLPIQISGGKGGARAMQEQAFQLLRTVGLEGFEYRYPRELSGGMQQRVAICRMLITEPKLLLMDEPFGALDELTRERMNVELAEVVSRQNNTAVFVTHNIGEAVFLSDSVWVMSSRPGRISGVVNIDLPRPRTLDLTTSSEFQSAVRAIRSVMDEWYDKEALDAIGA